MEEVWKDINLASLHDQPFRQDSHNTTTTTTNFRSMTFQDFLARPFNKEPPPPLPPRLSAGNDSPAPPLATALSLNSRPDQFHFLGNSDPLSPNLNLQAQPPFSYVCSLNVDPFNALAAAASSSLPASGKKRFPPESDNNSGGDRLHKRMIKNRESAARSRARKQAYTNELELEVAHLMEENARLKNQQQLFCLAATTQPPKKHSLHRSSTAPF
uniref:Putative FD protein n=1 Tax=Davidia involucrata TaxID=16924 RepID=A0A5B7C0S4_DAVIN